ncbi:hypothetical protein AGMMS50218_01040 [Actinomycetota bacterium]|nr:hypothetical protein AGMMS50218_01040 [Actinomycetota bacterium]
MSRIDELNERYAASAALARSGVEIVAVGDPAGARFNRAVRRLMAAIREDGPGLWDDLAGVSKALRWRLITQPQPMMFNQGLLKLAGEITLQARRLRDAVADQDLLDEIAAAATALADPDRESVVGTALVRTCLEAGADACVVIAASKPAQLGLTSWLSTHGITVMTAGEMERDQPDREQAYVVGPPRFYRSSLITAPVTEGVSFLLPAWFGDRSVPRSAIAPYAEGAIRVEARVFTVGDISEPEQSVPVEVEDEDVYLPQPIWGTRRSEDREPTCEEVDARKVLLSVNLAMWLDDGERIRSLDPQQPVGERVTYTEVTAVRAGTYLLLRQGATERGALYQAALARLGQRATAVDAAQAEWKQVLYNRLEQLGYGQVVKELRAAGVKTADRARAWTDPSLIRPNSDQDFESLLNWLGIPIQPTFGYASLLRKMLYQASAEIGRQLEAAVSAADLTELESTGHLSLDVRAEGFRGILATRVVAISPYSEIVSRHDARVPFEDRSGQWLE